MRSVYLLAVCILAACAVYVNAQAGYGFDVSGAASVSAVQCMISNGYSSGIVRAFRSSGTVDSNAATSIANAKSAGLTYVDVYIFPCPTCSSTALQQVTATKNAVNSAGPRIYWLDIEEDHAGQYWSTTYSTNMNFYAGLVSACSQLQIKCGIYSNKNNWLTIFGSSTYQVAGGSSLPLWYAAYDNNANFNNYAAFGGWSTPVMKQYTADATVCGLGIDKNWFPNAAAIWGSAPPSQCQGGCVDTSSCASINGKSTAGMCAGASNIQCCTPITCNTGSASGTCMSTTMCTADQGTSVAGYCAGATNIQCCIQRACTSGSSSGTCMDTTSCTNFGRTAVAGVCPGASNIQCCLNN